VLIIGMHRSGTRLLAQILNRLGVFMGADQQADSESATFMMLNETILHQCGAFWSEPMPAHFVLAEPQIVEQLAAGTVEALDGQLRNYLGSSGFRPEPSAEQAPAFGWKDPRNTFTLPVWRQIFPGLRVIHVLRHGVDVAASLSRRHAEALRSAAGEPHPSALIVIRDHVFGVLSSRRGWTLAEALTMWEQYVEKARLQLAELEGRALEVRFEDLLQKPKPVVAKIAEFCRLPEPASGTQLLGDLSPGRALAFKRDPELVAFAESSRAALERYGYSP
jgi:Sulfotransferase family